MIEKLKELAKKYHDVKESIDKLNQEKKDLTDEISVLVKEQSTKTDFVAIAFLLFLRVNHSKLTPKGLKMMDFMKSIQKKVLEPRL